MNILNCIGNTPFVKVKNLEGHAFPDIFVKLEEFNAGGSIKSRVALHMIEEAERTGRLSPGDTLIEATGGNTGLGLALVASLKNYRLVLVVPDNFSQEKIHSLAEYGADVRLSDSSTGPGSHIRLARDLCKANPGWVHLDQFHNAANPEVHYRHTGREILEVVPTVDYFVAGMGSGGTIAGVGRRLRESNTNVNLVGVQPEGCDILGGHFIPHGIQATAVGVVPSFFPREFLNRMVDVRTDQV